MLKEQYVVLRNTFLINRRHDRLFDFVYMWPTLEWRPCEDLMEGEEQWNTMCIINSFAAEKRIIDILI